MVEQMKLNIDESEEPVTIMIPRTKSGISFVVQLLENMRIESNQND